VYDQSLNERGKALLDRSNVFWIGPREYSLLPNYLRLFDVATIPFVINNITLASSPIKLYEYLAGGKPVITTAIPECQAFPEVHIVRDAQEFSRALDCARQQGLDEAYRKRLRDLARRNSWNARVQLISERLRAGREKNSIRDKLKEKLKEQRHVINSLSQQAAEQRQVIESLGAQLLREQAQLSKTTGALESLREHVEELDADLREKGLSLQVFSAQVSTKEAELRQIKRSLGWRLLSRYGRIKYRYLLPIYRLLRLAPKQTETAAVKQSSQDAQH
jgi:hypothetical protein